MAFYAEQLRRDEWYINGWSAVFYFKKVRYEEYLERKRREREEYQKWYNSLSDEERAKVDAEEAEKKRKNDEQVRRSLMRLMALPMALVQAYGGIHYRGMEERYGGAYKPDGTPNEEFFRQLSEERRREQEALIVDALN